jgi:hypothetical protein
MIHSSTHGFGRHEHLRNEDFIFREFPAYPVHYNNKSLMKDIFGINACIKSPDS